MAMTTTETDTTTTDVLDSDPNSAAMWQARISPCKRVRRDLIDGWSENVDFRRGKPFAQESDEERVNVNLDWALTKSKHDQLYSQTPQVYLTAKQDKFNPAIPSFQKQLNDTLTTARVGTAMDEAVYDAINASGVGVVLVSYKSTNRMVDVEPTMPPVPSIAPPVVDPSVDPLAQSVLPPAVPQAADPTAAPGVQTVPDLINSMYEIKRLSPSDFLWPIEFTGSDFDDADWVGYSGRMYWSEAVREFGLTEDDKQNVLSEKEHYENLRQDSESASQSVEMVVEYDEIFYWAYRFDANEKYYKRINRIVFVHGKEKPVKHEPWKGQKFDEVNRTYAGSCKFPLRVLTLTYISDDAIPPSDSAIGRPQVLEMIESRTNMVLNRRHSRPVRWADVNKMDPAVLDSLMRGKQQTFIPVNGDGNRAVGEIARASYPPEDSRFDDVIRRDLQEQWKIGSNQLGAFASGERSAREAGIVQQNLQVSVGYERSRVSAFFTGIAEVCAGYLALFGNFTVIGQEKIQQMDQAWNRLLISGEFVYFIRPDSTVLLDSNQRIDKLEKLLNLVGKSGFVNPKPIIEEIVALHGVDTEAVMVDPQPEAPDQPKLSFSFQGEDLLNPVAVAMLMRAGMAPTPEELQRAIQVVLAGIKGVQTAMNGTEQVAPMTPAEGTSGEVGPAGPTSPPVDAQPQWGTMPRVSRRVEDL